MNNISQLPKSFGKALLLGLMMLPWAQSALAQDKPVMKEDREGRLEHEHRMLINPATGQIPDNIRQKELDYVSSNPTLKGKNNKTTVWNRRGPYNVGGRTRALAIDVSNSNNLLAGGVSGGMWRSTDGGANWTKTTGSGENHSVSCIAQDPRNGFTNIWYYGSGEASGNSASASGAPFRGVGVYKSTDSGVTWTLLVSTATNPTSFTSPFQYCTNIVVNPTNGDVLLAHIGGIYRSSDGGTTWTQPIAFTGSTANFTDIAVTTTGVFYATVPSNASTSKGIYRSTDGVTWVNIVPASFPTTYARNVIGIAPSNQSVVYFFANTSGTGKNNHSFFKYTYVSGDGSGAGGTWENRSTNLPAYGGNVGNLNQGTYNQLVRVKPDNENFVVIGSTNLYRSTDAFATSTNNTWIGGYSPANNVSRYVNHHPDNHSFVFFAGSPNTAISGHDGGLSKTTDISNNSTSPANQPVLWTSLNNGYFTTQPYAVAIDPVTSGDNRMLAGFQDNGKWYNNTTASNDVWGEEVAGGDGCFVAIIPGTAEHIRYHSTQGGKVMRSKGSNPDNPAFVDGIQPSSATNQLFVNPFIIDPNSSEIMYYPAGTKLWRNDALSTINSGYTFSGTTIGWTEMTGLAVSSGSITALAVSKANSANVLYYGTSDGQLYRADNANSGTGTQVNIYSDKGFPAGYVNSISVDPNNSANVLVCFTNYAVKSIFYTTDSGVTWTDVSGNLEQNPDGTGNGPSVRWVTIHRMSSGDYAYLAGTSTGLYRSDALNGTSTTWTQEGINSIGNMLVVMMQSRVSDNLVAVATHGAGLYSGTVINANTVVADFSIGPRPLAYQGMQVTFTDLSLGNVTSRLWEFGNGASVATATTAGPHTVTYSTLGKKTIKLTVNGNVVKTKEITVLPTLPAFYQTTDGGNFETDNGHYFSEGDAGIAFQRGNSTVAGKDGVASGAFAYVTAPTAANYIGLSIANLYTPNFNFTPAGTYTLSFKTKFKTEAEWDGFVVQYSTNFGETWTNLGTAVQADWYNGLIIAQATGTVGFAGGTACFNGVEASYATKTYNCSSLAGNANVAFRFSFRTDEETTDVGVAIDDFKIDAPSFSLTNLSPANNATNVAAASNLVMTFSANAAKGTGNITIKKVSDNSIFETIDVTSGNVTVANAIVTINPTNDLATDTQYYVEVANGAITSATSISYAGFTSSSTWKFTTVDTQAPTSMTLSPANGANNASNATNLVITFSEAVAKGTGNITIKKTSDNSTFATIDVTSNVVTVSGSQVTINPANDLEAGVQYYVLIDNGAIKDIANNNFAGFSTNASWQFTTVDVTAPTTTAFSPANNTTQVALASNLMITFSENVQKGTGNIVIKKVSDNSIFATIDVAGSNVTVSTTTVTIDPANDLQAATQYYVEVASGAIKDMSNNAFAGFTGSTTWKFTSLDNVAPTLTSTNPADNATTFSGIGNMEMTFSENVKKGATGTIIVKRKDNNTAVATFDMATASGASVTVANNKVTFPAQGMVHDTEYFVEVSNTAIEDLVGNKYAGLSGNTAWDFKTDFRTAIENNQLAKKISLYPNPVAKEATLTLEDASSFKEVALQVFDAKGVVVWKREAGRLSEKQTLNFANLPAGKYFLQVRVGDAVALKPFVKTR